MNEPTKSASGGNAILGAAMASGYAALNSAAAIVALLVDSGTISRSAGAAALTRIANETRADVENCCSSVMGTAFARWLEEVAATYA